MSIHSIIFDLGNVIINLKEESTWWQEDIFPYFDADIMAQLVQKGFFNLYEKGQIDDETFRMELHMARKYDSEPEVADNCWNALLQDIPAERVHLLQQLAAKYNLYLLSNTNNIHLQHILELSHREFGYDLFDTHFKQCFYSHLLKMRKPDPDIYTHAWGQAGIPFEGSLYLDDKAINLEAPAAMGVLTLLIDPSMGMEKQLPPILSLY